MRRLVRTAAAPSSARRPSFTRCAAPWTRASATRPNPSNPFWQNRNFWQKKILVFGPPRNFPLPIDTRRKYLEHLLEAKSCLYSLRISLVCQYSGAPFRPTPSPHMRGVASSQIGSCSYRDTPGNPERGSLTLLFWDCPCKMNTGGLAAAG